MGADGHFQLLPEAEFKQEWPNVEPSELGLIRVEILGIPCVTRYWDTEDRDDMDDVWDDLGFTLARKLDIASTRLRMVREQGKDGVYQSDYMKRQGRPPLLESDLAKEVAQLENNPAMPHSYECRQAQFWFEAKAQDICVWT